MTKIIGGLDTKEEITEAIKKGYCPERVIVSVSKPTFREISRERQRIPVEPFTPAKFLEPMKAKRTKTKRK